MFIIDLQFKVSIGFGIFSPKAFPAPFPCFKKWTITPSLPLLKIPDERRHAIDILPEGGIAATLPQFMLLKGHKLAMRRGISLLFIKKILILRGLTLSAPGFSTCVKARSTGKCPHGIAASGAIGWQASMFRNQVNDTFDSESACWDAVSIRTRRTIRSAIREAAAPFEAEPGNPAVGRNLKLGAVSIE